MARVKVHYEVASTNEVKVEVSLEGGTLFGKWNSPFFWGEGDEAGVCHDPCCRRDKGDDHVHTTGIHKTFPTIGEAVECGERIIREAETSQAAYLAAKETLQRELPPDREVIIPE